MDPIIVVSGIILIAFTRFYRGVPSKCCRLAPQMSWDENGKRTSASTVDKIPSRKSK